MVSAPAPTLVRTARRRTDGSCSASRQRPKRTSFHVCDVTECNERGAVRLYIPRKERALQAVSARANGRLALLCQLLQHSAPVRMMLLMSTRQFVRRLVAVVL